MRSARRLRDENKKLRSRKTVCGYRVKVGGSAGCFSDKVFCSSGTWHGALGRITTSALVTVRHIANWSVVELSILIIEPHENWSL